MNGRFLFMKIVNLAYLMADCFIKNQGYIKNLDGSVNLTNFAAYYYYNIIMYPHTDRIHNFQ